MRILVIIAAAAALLSLQACDSRDEAAGSDAGGTTRDTPVAAADDGGTVLQAAQANPEFSILVEAIVAADLAATLNGAGPFTIFAPTNTAFEKIPAARREALMRPEGRQQLQSILTRHVVPGRLPAADIAAQAEAGGGALRLTSVEGAVLSLAENDGQWIITDEAGNTSVIAMPDVAASNGVIHAVDTVLMPD